MILQETKTVPIADADWTDDGTVELVTFPHAGEHRTHMAPETARALAQRLVEAATDAENAAAESQAQRADRVVEHGFDMDLPEAPRTDRSFIEVLSAPPADDVGKTPHSEICGVQRRWNGGHCVCAVTPPADDVREALARAIWKASPDLERAVLADARVIADAVLADPDVEVRPRGTVVDAPVGQLREARAETWDEAVAAVFAWWKAPEGERPLAIVNPYGVGPGGDGEATREVHP